MPGHRAIDTFLCILHQCQHKQELRHAHQHTNGLLCVRAFFGLNFVFSCCVFCFRKLRTVFNVFSIITKIAVETEKALTLCGLSHAACGSTEDIGALSLVLQIIDASQELHQTVAHVKKLTPSGSAAAAAAADKDQGLANTDQGSLVMQHAVSKFTHFKYRALHVDA